MNGDEPDDSPKALSSFRISDLGSVLSQVNMSVLSGRLGVTEDLDPGSKYNLGVLEGR